MQAFIQTARILHRDEKRIALYFDKDPQLIEQVKRIPGRKWSATLNCWHIPETEDALTLVKAINLKNNAENKQGEQASRIYFFLPPQAFGLRQKIKSIAGRYWHGDEKKWSLPDTGQNRMILEQLKLKYRAQLERIDIQEKPRSVPTGTTRKKQKKSTNEPIRAGIMESIDAFERWMEQKRYSRNTINSYTSFVKSFFAENIQKSLQEFTDTDIIEYNHKKFIKGNQSYSTHNQFINAIKLFFSYHKILQIDPEQIERPRKQSTLPNVLSKEEVGKVLSMVANQKQKCLLAFVYGAGLRIGEVIDLEIKDIRAEEKLIYIRKGKGGKDRRVPLSEKMISLFRSYQASYRPQVYAFEGQKGGKYTTSSAAKILKRAIRDAGIKTEATLHTLRHSYATHLMESGVGLRYIQEVLGHNSPKTTMIYTHISGRRLSEIKSPLDDLEI